MVERFEPFHSSNIVCIGVRWNLLGQVVGAPGVGVLIGRCVEKGVGYNMTAPKDSLEGAEGLSKLFMPYLLP